MTNTNLLKAAIAENGYTQEAVSREIGMSRVSFNMKLNNEREFTASEIFKICDVLKIKDKDPIFFNDIVDLKSTT